MTNNNDKPQEWFFNTLGTGETDNQPEVELGNVDLTDVRQASINGLIDLYNEHVIKNKEKQMNKKKSYKKLVEDFDRGGGRAPYSEEVDAWESGWNDGFKAAKQQMKAYIKTLDGSSDKAAPLHIY